eukprot:COSAG02_NODE_4447_length_5313_cov_2.314656_1_plen_208_part_00
MACANFSHFKEKSDAAQRREDAAKTKFDAHRHSIEASIMMGHGVDTDRNVLLQPDCHLTAPCCESTNSVTAVHVYVSSLISNAPRRGPSGRDFKKYVQGHRFWRAKRRVATPLEKTAAKQTRKGKCYFVEVFFVGSFEALLNSAAAGSDEAPPMGLPVVDVSPLASKLPIVDFSPELFATGPSDLQLNAEAESVPRGHDGDVDLEAF